MAQAVSDPVHRRVFSYAGSVIVGVIADAQRIAEPQLVSGAFGRCFEELEAAAGLVHGRKP